MRPLGRDSPQTGPRLAFGRYSLERALSTEALVARGLIKGLHFPGRNTRLPTSLRPIIARGVASACRQDGQGRWDHGRVSPPPWEQERQAGDGGERRFLTADMLLTQASRLGSD